MICIAWFGKPTWSSMRMGIHMAAKSFLLEGKPPGINTARSCCGPLCQHCPVRGGVSKLSDRLGLHPGRRRRFVPSSPRPRQPTAPPTITKSSLFELGHSPDRKTVADLTFDIPPILRRIRHDAIDRSPSSLRPTHVLTCLVDNSSCQHVRDRLPSNARRRDGP